MQSWARKVTTYGFHIVPVPVFLLDGKPAESDPFTPPHFISVDETCFKRRLSEKGKEN